VFVGHAECAIAKWTGRIVGEVWTPKAIHRGRNSHAKNEATNEERTATSNPDGLLDCCVAAFFLHDQGNVDQFAPAQETGCN